MKKPSYLALLFIVIFAVSCSSSDKEPADPDPDPLPGEALPDNEFKYKGVKYTLTEAEVTRPLESNGNDNVSVLVLWGLSEDGLDELRFEMVVNTQSAGLTDGSYTYQHYSADSGHIRWGSVALYLESHPYLESAEFISGQLDVYHQQNTCILIIEATTAKSHKISGKFKGEL